MKKQKLLRLFRQSDHCNFIKFLDELEENGVYYMEDIFKEKSREDKEIKEALERVNNLGKTKTKEKE